MTNQVSNRHLHALAAATSPVTGYGWPISARAVSMRAMLASATPSQ